MTGAFSGLPEDRVRKYQRGGPELAGARRDILKSATLIRKSRLRFVIGDAPHHERLTAAMKGCDDIMHAAVLERVPIGWDHPIDRKTLQVNELKHVLRR
ncbi:hypothetical protein [Methylovirgula sp. HY1]|uniref:hypothetical protein n=1 Tax=Methylovirgula sp. HY1 TaxID=2822761 RepID=UPI001C5BC603|nr:hypothetical protein [Methylovirgula sp. HY1]